MTGPATLPTKVNRMLAEASVQEYLSDSQWQARAKEYGWIVKGMDALTLLVTMRARPISGPEDLGELYTLRLICEYYPTYPPDVQFVNPATNDYDAGKDGPHLPNLAAPYCHMHPTYNYRTGYPYGVQLVCNSLTLAYYFSEHNPPPEQAWKPGYHKIGSSLWTIYKALHSSHYTGRRAA